MSRLLCLTELPRRGPPRRRDRQSPFTESNRRPSPYHGDALPTELKGPARSRCSGRILRRAALAPTAELTRPAVTTTTPIPAIDGPWMQRPATPNATRTTVHARILAMDCRSTRLAGGAVPCASEESRMPETAELTALP